MHITIDKERMVFLRKHASIEVLANLAWIESHEAPLALFPIESARTLSCFSELELRTLYFNTTGVEFPQGKYSQLIQILFDIMHRMPVDEVNAFEVNAQAEHIKDDAKYRYQYVKGSTKPARKADLFEPDPKKVSRDKNEELMAMNGRLPAIEALHSKTPVTAPEPLKVKTGPTVVVTTPKVKATPAAPVASVKQPTQSFEGKSKKDIIWGVTQQLWKDGGSPMEIPKILAIRKIAMDKLESEYGISRTSASSSMAGWQKQILE